MKHGDCARPRLLWRRPAGYEAARPLFERAITISEAVRGPDDVFIGMLLHDLAGGALETRDDGRAELLQRRALAIFDKAWGDGHPYSAMARLRIAVLLHIAGQRAQAEALLRQSDAGDREHARNRPCLVCHVSQGAGEYPL